jgi:hypothetical protein
MKLRTLCIAALALATAAFGVMTAKSPASPAAFNAAKALTHAPRAHCPKPSTLRLARFEDGSAQLKCAERVLLRVSAPG